MICNLTWTWVIRLDLELLIEDLRLHRTAVCYFCSSVAAITLGICSLSRRVIHIFLIIHIHCFYSLYVCSNSMHNVQMRSETHGRPCSCGSAERKNTHISKLKQGPYILYRNFWFTHEVICRKWEIRIGKYDGCTSVCCKAWREERDIGG